MTEEQKTQAKKLLTFKDNPNLALFDELQELNKNILALTEAFSTHTEMMSKGMGDMCDKMDTMNEKEPPEMPEMPEMDMTETNNLLKALLKEEQKPEEPIEITMDIV